MRQKTTLTKIMVAMAVTLLSLPAAAQLSLSAGAKAEADTKGADASATADGDAAAADDAAAEGTAEEGAAAEEDIAPPPPPPPAPEPEPAVEAAPAAGDTGATAAYDKGFIIQSNDGNNKLKINGIVKTRWDFLNDEFGVVDPDTGDAGSNHTMHSAFNLPYARLGLSGTFLTPKLGYMLMYDFAAQQLIYAYSKWTFIPEVFELQVGWFKRPFSRQYLTSSAKQMFVDNPIGQMGTATDVGVQISNNFTAVKGLEWAVGVFNGTRGVAIAPVNGDFSPVLVGRIGYNNGIKGYSDTDFEGGPLRFGIGFSASTEFDHDDDNFTQHYLELDGTLKVNGLGLSAAGYMGALDEDGFWDVGANGGPTPGLVAVGSYVQAGYLINGMIEPVARYSFIHMYDVPDDLRQKITAGLAIHFFKDHQFKLQNELSLDIQRGPDPLGEITAYQDILFTSMLQYYF